MSKPVTHYDNGDCFFGPISGRHTVAICGQSLQDNYKPNQKRTTTIIENVTCKNCLKRLSVRKENK